jgi:very-short-patch-repair endonuclease
MREKRAPEREVAAIAQRQHGAVSVDQLHRAGLSNAAVARRVRSGRLHRLHRGVYAVGHIAPSDERRWMAAVLACAPTPEDGQADAALSHRDAAALWELLPAGGGPVDVSLLGRGGKRKRSGIRIHRPRSLRHEEVARRHGIPVTSPARTLSDLQSVVSTGQLRHAIRQADFLGLPTGPEHVPDRTRSELERRFLWLCRRHGLPEPTVNIRVGPLTVDFCWAEQRLIVETDGFRSHRGRAAFEDDRDRDLMLRGLGYDVQHLSYRQVFDDSDRVVAVLRTALGHRGAR